MSTDISLSKRAGTLGLGSVAITFNHQLQMNGIAPPITPLLKACGYKNTGGVFTPRTTGFESCTMWVWEENILWKIAGCRGNADWNFKAGDPVSVAFNMQGRWAVPIDSTYPTSVTDNGGKPCVAMNRAFVFSGDNPVTESLQFSLNNAITLQPNLDDSVSQGIEEVAITGRDAKGSFNPEVVLAATTDFYAIFSALTQTAITYVVGDGTDNMTISLPKCELENVSPGDQSGIAIYDIPFHMVRTTADDEISLTFAAA